MAITLWLGSLVKDWVQETEEDDTVSDWPARFLFTHQIACNSTTDSSSAELMFGRNIRSHFDHIQPNLAARVASQQITKKRCMRTMIANEAYKLRNRFYVHKFWPDQHWLQSISEWLFEMANRKWHDVLANGVTSYIALASHYTVIGFGARVV